MSVFRDILNGSDILLTRKDELETLLRHLLKPTPDHVSVIGPRGYGKSPLLRATLGRLEAENVFDSIVYWDLRHDGEFVGDRAFLDALWRRIEPVLLATLPGLADELGDAPAQDILRTLFDYLEDQDRRILVLLDGLDRLLLSPSITRNLWDFLRSLAERRSLTLVTASRRRLRELCANPDSRTSDFWNIFYETPLVVGACGNSGWSDVVNALKGEGCEIDELGLKELMNWTGGIPRLVLYLCDRLCASSRTGVVGMENVDAIAEQVAEECQDAIADIWETCSARQQTLLIELEEGGALRKDEVGGIDLNELCVKGLVRTSGDSIEPGARLVHRYGIVHGEQIIILRDLLGTPKKFRENMFSLMQLRLDSAAGIDPDVRRELELVINVVKEYPARAADLLRNVAGVALDKILETELPPDGKIPREWMDEWRSIDRFHFTPHENPPRLRAQKRNTVRAIVDNRTSCHSRISFATYLLLDHVYHVGNYGNHIDEMGGEDVPFLFVAHVVLQAIYLTEKLADELSPSFPA